MLIVNDIGRSALALAFAVLIRGDGLGAVPLTVYAQPEPVGLPPLLRSPGTLISQRASSIRYRSGLCTMS